MEDIEKNDESSDNEEKNYIETSDGKLLKQPPLPGNLPPMVKAAQELGGKLTHLNDEPVDDPISNN